MNRNSCGFTLLEVVIALAILAGVITTVVVTFNRHLTLATEDRDTTTALLLARAKLDQPDFLTVTTASGTFAPDFPEFSWKREETVSEIPTLKRYQLTVSWNGGQRSLQLVLYGT